MKSYYLMLLAALCFSAATGLTVYKYFDEEVEKAFEKGVAIGKRSMQPHRTDSIILKADESLISYWQKPNSEVDSVEVMIIHYNPEIKK